MKTTRFGTRTEEIIDNTQPTEGVPMTNLPKQHMGNEGNKVWDKNRE